MLTIPITLPVAFAVVHFHEHEPAFSRSHLANKNVRVKLRQQLQAVHELGLVDALRARMYRKTRLLSGESGLTTR